MHIGIDGNEANTSQRVGSNIYAEKILKGLHQQDSKTKYTVYLKKPPLADLPSAKPNWSYRVFGPSFLWTQWRLPFDLYLTHSKPKIFFTPSHYSPRFSPVPSVISIMDLAFLHYPESFKPIVLSQLKSWTKYSVQAASHIFTISENSKKDIIKTYGISEKIITVTYPGSNLASSSKLSLSSIQETKRKLKIEGNYLIFVGTLQPRKNLTRLLQAFEKLQEKHPKIKLVIVGKTWHQFSEQKLQPTPNTIYTGFVTDKQLADLISCSIALVFPSLYEGFGIPVLEAMKLGTLVTASRSSSIPEITGNSPLLFDPTRVEDITKKLNQVLTLKKEQKKKLINQGKIRAENFTWKKAVTKTMEVLHELTT